MKPVFTGVTQSYSPSRCRRVWHFRFKLAGRYFQSDYGYSTSAGAQEGWRKFLKALSHKEGE